MKWLDETYSEGEIALTRGRSAQDCEGSSLISRFALINVSGSLIASAGCNLR